MCITYCTYLIIYLIIIILILIRFAPTTLHKTYTLCAVSFYPILIQSTFVAIDLFM